MPLMVAGYRWRGGTFEASLDGKAWFQTTPASVGLVGEDGDVHSVQGRSQMSESKMAMETVVVVHVTEEKDADGNVEQKREDILALDTLRVEKPSTREDILRREDVHEVTKDIPGRELEVLVASVPFREIGGC